MSETDDKITIGSDSKPLSISFKCPCCNETLRIPMNYDEYQRVLNFLGVEHVK